MNYRKTIAGILFSASFIALMAANEGKAQTANAGANAGASSSAGSSSNSGSGAAAVINQNTTNTVPANTTSTNTTNVNERFSGGTNSTVTNQGYTSSDVTVRSAPQVYAPPVSGGNPCTLAVSAGVSVIGWGAAGGGTFVDEDCARRQKIAMIHNSGQAGIAFELMCNDRETYNAAKSAGGKQCAFRPDFEPKGAAAPAPQVYAPTPVVMPAPMVQAQPKVYPRCTAQIRDNCQS
jgi:hypothetical protein